MTDSTPARDVIARSISPMEWDNPVEWRPMLDDVFHARRNALLDRADAVIAALHDAGYVVTKHEPKPKKPQPDWGRKGTQPKGTLGDPPPPNGKPVAMKPTKP